MSAVELGYPAVQETGRNGSKRNMYVGNGDEVTFGYMMLDSGYSMLADETPHNEDHKFTH